jgi:hypothetical protein
MFPVTRSTSRSRFFKPAAATPAPATDPFFEYVTLLVNTNSTNGAQNNTFLDSSTNNFSITRNGDTTQGSFNPYMPSGYWSGFFDGTGDWLSVPDNAAFDLAAGDWTVETWVNFSSIPSASGASTFVAQWSGSGGPQLAWWFYLFNSAGTYQLFFSYSTTGSNQTNLLVNLAAAPVVGEWNHVAFVRSGNNYLVFWNGTQVGSTQTLSATIFNASQSIGIGQLPAGSPTYNLTGYLSNLRIVKGTAVYTANFTPSTTPLTAITNTSLLCLQDNRFKDNSTNAFAITVNGDTRISKFAPFNPPASYSTASYGGSGYFDGNGDELNAGSNAAFSFGTGAYTVECWVYLNQSVSASHRPIFVGNNTAGGFLFYNPETAGQLQIVADGGGTVLVANTNLSPNIWNHIVAVRSGTGANQTAIFVNGSRVANGTDATNWTVTGPLKVGGITLATYYINGYVSNLRVVKGTAVYDPTLTTLTVPTTPLTAITNTSLLLNFTNAGIFDAATINNGQTVGNAQVSTTQAKWSPTSMSFDGTGDYVTVIDKPELRIGTGDFTIEGWVYLNATGVAYGLVSKGTASTGWSVNVTSGNKLQFSYTATQLTGATSLASGTWYYFAAVRSGTASGNLRVILNGSTDATSAGAVNDNFNQTSTMYVGADRVAGAVLNGYLQDVRITNGYARTTSTPTAAFPTL